MEKESEKLRNKFREHIKLSGKEKSLEEMCEIQEEGIILANRILNNKNCLMIADDVGLGKTYEGLGIIFSKFIEKSGQNILIIAPNEQIGLKWKKEYDYFKDNCIINIKDENIPECNVYLNNPFELLNIKNDGNNHVSIIRVNKFSYIKDIINKENTENLINFVKDDKEKLKANVENIKKAIKEYNEGKSENYENIASWCINVLSILNNNLREFDLAIIDESQNLRGDESTLKNKFINTFFGLYRFNNPDGNKMKFKRSVLLTATPDHNKNIDIFNQFKYFIDNKKHKELFDSKDDSYNNDKIEWLDKFDAYNQNNSEKLSIIRRSRKFNGKEKYAYREFKDIPAECNFLENMTFKLLHKRIINSDKNFCEMKYIDGFESFIQNESDNKNYDEDERKNKIDNDTFYIDDWIKKLNEQDITINHPKIRKIKEELKKDSKLDKIDKTLIFARRISSTKELEKVLIDNYDEKIDKLVQEMLDINEKKDIMKEFKKIENKFRESKSNEGNDEIDDETSDKKSMEVEEDSDENQYKSRWLKQIKENKNSEVQTDIVLFKKKFYKNMPFADFFEENFLKIFGYDINIKSNEKEKAVILWKNKQHSGEIEIYNFEVEDKIQNYKISLSDRSIKDTDFKRVINLIIFEKLEENDSRIKIFNNVYKLFYFKEEKKENVNVIVDLGRISNICFKEEKSIWGIEAIKDALNGIFKIPSIDDINGVNIDNLKEEKLKKELFKREIVKDIIIKNLRNGEGILYFYCLYFKFKIDSTNIKEKFEEQIKEKCTFAIRIFNRIIDFINNFEAENKILGIDYDESYYNKKIPISLSPVAKCSSIQKQSIPNNTKCFNTSFFPDIIVATDIIKEGIDLQINCSKIINYGIAWLPGDIEQRIGRIDRYFSKTYREFKENPTSRVDIEFLYTKDTLDEEQVARVLNRYIKSIMLKDFNGIDYNYDNTVNDDIESNDNVPNVKDEINILNELSKSKIK